MNEILIIKIEEENGKAEYYANPNKKQVELLKKLAKNINATFSFFYARVENEPSIYGYYNEI